MTDSSSLRSRARAAIRSVPARFRGPGGCIAVVQGGGAVVETYAFGYADLDERVPMTTQTKLPFCSVSKQMVCMAFRAGKQEEQDSVRDEVETKLFPELKGSHGLCVEHLCHNQSGLRDYWCLTTLWGARAGQKFTLREDAPAALERTRRAGVQFAPGTEYAYCNLNFHAVGRALERAAGKGLREVLAERVFGPAEMATAELLPDTAELPGPCVGYVGDEKGGYHAAANRIEWSGDAGVIGTVEDFVSYEKWLQRSWEDASSAYRAIAAAQQTYADGAPADYHYGLADVVVAGRRTIGHAGGLSGFRLYRLHVPEEQLSVVVFFNYHADIFGACEHVLKRIWAGTERVQTTTPLLPRLSRAELVHWEGEYLAEEPMLMIRIRADDEGNILLRYAHDGGVERVRAVSARRAESEEAVLELDGETLRMRLTSAHTDHVARRIAAVDTDALQTGEWAGVYESTAVESTMHVTGEGGMLYAAFDGFLGRGPQHLVRVVGADIAALADPRTLDEPPPGLWTLVLRRDAHGRVVGLTIGCWLARKIEFAKRDGRISA